jgi:hypothetical protein
MNSLPASWDRGRGRRSTSPLTGNTLQQPQKASKERGPTSGLIWKPWRQRLRQTHVIKVCAGKRIGMQLQEMAPATKVISYMWDPYYTCEGTAPALTKELEKGFTVPLVADSSFDAGTGELQVVGFNLSRNMLHVKWIGKDGKDHSIEVMPARVDEAYGENLGLNPRLQAAVLKIDAGPSSPEELYVLSATNKPN